LKESNAHKIAVRCFGIAVVLVLLCSCVSFDIGDWPSRFVYPHNSPTANLCGIIGAFLAYFLFYYIGPGVFVLLFATAGFLIARLIDRPVEQMIFRIIGSVLLTIAASASFYCIWPYSVYEFPTGSGGLLGVAVATFLRGHFAVFGTFILLSAVWLAGLILLADSLVITVFKNCTILFVKAVGTIVPAWTAAKEQSKALSQIWRKLSIKQKVLPQKLSSLSLPSLKPPKGLSKTQVLEKATPSEIKVTEKLKVSTPVVDKPQKDYIPPSYDDYTLPPLELLAEPEFGYSAVQSKVVEAKATTLEQLLSEFNVNASVVAAETGPVVTMFELELAAGVKVSQIAALANDMARALGAGAVRVVAPLPGKHTIGIEVPNSEKETVRIKNLISLAGDKPQRMAIPLFLGKDSSGQALVSDLTAMPHLLIAGTTGSGKSVCINSIITSILLTKRPDEVKLILIDPKMVEMTAFNMIPHLMTPIVTETQRAVQILQWATVKMDERYALLAEARVKNIAGYNALGSEEIIKRFNPTTADEEAKIPKKLPCIVIIIDELADLMITAPKDIEAYIVRLAQKSRAVGIHIVLATQRPQATVVTGLIKSNMPTRIGFRVAARMDSRIILDQNGAETLLGQGDMLFLKPGTSDLVRAQGAFVDEPEIKRVVKHLKEIAEPQFHPELTQLGRMDISQMDRDEIFDDAVRVVLESQRGSVSLLQRRLSIGYARASRIIEMMAASGILGEYKGSQAREVLMTIEQYENIRKQMQADAEADYKDLADRQEDSAAEQPGEGQKEYISVENED